MDRARGIGRAGVCGQGGEVWMGGQVEGLGGYLRLSRQGAKCLSRKL